MKMQLVNDVFYNFIHWYFQKNNIIKLSKAAGTDLAFLAKYLI